ncbi:ABC transporter permease [Methanothermococcus sp.]|uniref:ABC transporter permease n=1 Tax=Methanothermococcus sp. TaxID=2614238 RepID=UPI0025F5DFC4|nr:FtsX-like permease family protein [Methanothermococcus sp.]
MYFEMAKRNLKRHTLRSILALLGIIIGVMAISSLGILGGGLKEGISKNFEGVANFVVVFPNTGEGYLHFTKRDVDKLRKLNCKVIPICTKSDIVYIKGKNKKTYASIYGIKKEDIKYLNLGVDNKLSDTTIYIDSVFSNLNDVNKNDMILIKNVSFRIRGTYNSSFFIISQNSIILSQKTYKRFYGDNYSMVVLYVKNKDDINNIKNETENIMNKKEKKVIILSMDTLLKSINDAMDKLSMFLIGIGSISLLVAGIGIGNVMLMSTIERTKEIGVMKSIGASKRDIMILFIYEALIIGIIGSLIGALMSVVIGYLIVVFLLKSSLAWYCLIYVLIGILFGVGTSLISALYPAYKAATLDPIKALRSE